MFARTWAISIHTVTAFLYEGVVLIPAGFIPSPAGAVTPYIPTAVELGIVLATWCAGAMLVTILFRIAIAAQNQIGGGSIISSKEFDMLCQTHLLHQQIASYCCVGSYEFGMGVVTRL
jgi:hypothetical protein